jgi:hypothetical protein
MTLNEKIELIAGAGCVAALFLLTGAGLAALIAP